MNLRDELEMPSCIHFDETERQQVLLFGEEREFPKEEREFFVGPCPFALEIHGSDRECICCDECIESCAMDI